MRIGEVAGRAGLSPAACRYYERYGLLPRPPRLAGKRDYDPSVVTRLALIGFARQAGLSLAEIRELLQPGPTHERWRAVRTRHLEKLRDLERLVREQRRLVRATEACACTTPEECGRMMSAGLAHRRMSRVHRSQARRR